MRSDGGRFSTPGRTDSVAHPASYTMGTGSVSREYGGRSMALTNNPHLAPRLKKPVLRQKFPFVCNKYKEIICLVWRRGEVNTGNW
jgi:hypothetical protein